jgi:hypothetical protein
MVNTVYNLAGGMDTPSLAAEKRYEQLGSELFDLDGRLSRDWRSNGDGASGMMGGGGSAGGKLGGDRNGKRKTQQDEEEEEGEDAGVGAYAYDDGKTQQQDSGWGSLVIGAIGGVVAGAWTFCKKSAFRGFYAGGGQGYAMRQHQHQQPGYDDPFGHESMWEDEQDPSNPMSASMRSFERLSTPVPGEYPEDSPPPEDINNNNGGGGGSNTRYLESVESERRPAKRRQTDGGGWVVVDKTAAANRSRTGSRSSPRLSTPPINPRLATHHHNSAHTSARPRAASLKRPMMLNNNTPASSRSSRPRISAVSHTGSPARPSTHSHSRHASLSSGGIQLRPPRSPGMPSTTVSGDGGGDGAVGFGVGIGVGPNMSPPSVEAKRFAARVRKEERAAGKRYDRLNDQLMEMIKQGKEALGSKIEVVENENENDADPW